MFAGLIAGAAVGTVAGLLLAPKPGKESRDIVVARAGGMRQKAGGYVEAIRSRKRNKENHPVMAESSNGHANGTA